MYCLRAYRCLAALIVVSIVLMYRAMRMQLQPFCTITDCNRSCHQVHRQNQESSTHSVSADFLKAKRNLLWRQNYSFAQGERNCEEVLLEI